LFLTAIRRECDETVEMRERRHSATACVEKILLLAPGTFRRGTMLVNSLTKVSKVLKMFRIGKTNRARQSGRIFLGADYANRLESRRRQCRE